MKIKEKVKNSIRPFIPQILLNIWSKKISKRRLIKWRKSGCPVPPPHIVKRLIIKEYQEKFGYNILVETGTLMGDMVEAQRKRFKKIVSIELDVNLAKTKKI